MSARSIARELAVIVLPQLPKNKEKLEVHDINQLVAKAVHMLCDYAKQNLAEANAAYMQAANQLLEIEVEHPDNRKHTQDLAPVTVTTAQLREQLTQIERAMHYVSEALDVPDMLMLTGHKLVKSNCNKCGHVQESQLLGANSTEVLDFVYTLVSTYVEHKNEIDKVIQSAKSTWKVERMISIDRDILRLALTEAFFIEDVPVNVAISEAVELSHRFADEKAAKYINGILADLSYIAKQYRTTGVILELTDAAVQEKMLESKARTGR